MKRKLKPLTGALIAGLIGVAQATCWYEQSSVCMTAETPIGFIGLPGCSSTIYAATDWYKWDVFETSVGNDLGNLVLCEGPAYFIHCQNQQRVDITADDGTQVYYQRVSSTACYN